MYQYSTRLSRTTWILSGILSGAAVGAAAMYLLDPVQGRRRRALVRDKAYSSRVKMRKSINAKSRDLANRAKGLRAEARHRLSQKAGLPGTQAAMFEI